MPKTPSDDKQYMPYIEYDMPVTIHAPKGIQLDTAQAMINKYYMGRPKIPLDVPVSPNCKEAHYNLHRGQVISIKVRVYANGDKEIIPPVMDFTKPMEPVPG